MLLVDEAHTLPFRLLEEIRLLTNLTRNDQPLVRLVLAGGPVLEERFASPKLDSFSQRLSARCYLEALNRTETKDYIQSQINAAGGRGDRIFPEAACQSVFQATGGVPRLINQVCDHALLLAYVAGRKTIEPASIEEAWADLQQLPTPWTEGRRAIKPNSGVIEFGALDDPAGRRPERRTDAAGAGLADFARRRKRAGGATVREPGQQIHRIERLLAEADDDFQPAGSIGPEVELCFEETPHPFQEEFEHEEVVAERYAAAAVAAATRKRIRPRADLPPEPELVSAAVLASAADSLVADEPPEPSAPKPSSPVAPVRQRGVSAVVRPTSPRLTTWT